MNAQTFFFNRRPLLSLTDPAGLNLWSIKLNKYSLFFAGILLFFGSVMAVAHEGEPNMAFAWRDGKIEIDIQRKGRPLADYTAFVIPFTDTFRPYFMGDSGFTGVNFDQGGIASYQTESTLLKWSAEQSQWLQEGFPEQLVISRLGGDTLVTTTEGNGSLGFIANLRSTNFETHPVFRMQKPDETPPKDGAYLVFMTILGVDDAGEHILYKPSEPFALIFHLNVQQNFNNQALVQALQTEPQVVLNDYDRMDALFDWAETQYSELFPHSAASRFISGYYARCYDNAICVGSKDGHVYTADGISGALAGHGPIETFYDAAGL